VHQGSRRFVCIEAYTEAKVKPADCPNRRRLRGKQSWAGRNCSDLRYGHSGRSLRVEPNAEYSIKGERFASTRRLVAVDRASFATSLL